MKFIVSAMILFSLVVSLGGCTTLGGPSLTPEEVAARDDQSCAAYGFKEGTDAFAQCRLQLAEQHHTDDIERRKAIAASLEQMSQDLRQSQPTTCTSTTSGTAAAFGPTINYNGLGTTTCY